MNTAIPQRLGDFEIIRELGRGGMGIVYEARQVSLNRQVALKVLGGGLGLTGKAVQRFRREAEAAAKLHHTNIVPVYATGEQDGSHFYAMELIEGPSLDKVLRQLRQPSGEASQPGNPDVTGPYVARVESPTDSLPPLSASSLGSGSPYFDTVARLVAEVADALDYAHQNGIIHRDIKPSNLLLSPQGRLSVNDFGLARVLEQPGLTLTGEFVGTPAYMSPEQITAGRIPLDHRTDIYSLGATLYELLTLEPPFRGQSREQVLAQIVQKEPRPPRKLNKKAPVDVETICLKALEKDPDHRYQTAGAMAEDLRRYVNRFAISARRAGPVERAKKWVKRHPAVAAALACASFLALLAAFFAFQAFQAQQQIKAEQRERALDNALVAASSGDEEQTEKAIKEAEVRGVSTGQVRMLRGYVAFQKGDFTRAAEELEQAVTLLPDSVAARALLVIVYNHAGELRKYTQRLEETDRLTPITPEDYLFKGMAESFDNAARAQDTLNQGIRLRDTPLGRAIRAEARSYLTLSTNNLKVAEQAVLDAQVAKEALPAHPYVLSVSLIAHVVAAEAYRRAGKPENRVATLKEAQSDAQALDRYATLPDPASALWWYHESLGEEEKAVAMLQRAADRNKTNWIMYMFCISLYRQGHLAQARAVQDRWEKGKGFIREMLEIMLLAEASDDGVSRALKACREAIDQAIARQDGLSRLESMQFQELLLFLRHKDLAIALSQRIRTEAPPFSRTLPLFCEQLLSFHCNDITAEELLSRAAKPEGDMHSACWAVGLRCLSEGNLEGARDHFRKGAAVPSFGWITHDLCWAVLGRMENDPTWPPWIPVK